MTNRVLVAIAACTAVAAMLLADPGEVSAAPATTPIPGPTVAAAGSIWAPPGYQVRKVREVRKVRSVRKAGD